MTTKQLAVRLIVLELERDQHEQERLFNKLKSELEQDDLDLFVDEHHNFAVKVVPEKF